MNAACQRPLAVGLLRALCGPLMRWRGCSARALRPKHCGSRRRPSCGRHLAIPRQIRRLEDALGATHFLRGKRHVEMTGQRALPLRNLAPQLVQMNVALCATSS